MEKQSHELVRDITQIGGTPNLGNLHIFHMLNPGSMTMPGRFPTEKNALISGLDKHQMPPQHMGFSKKWEYPNSWLLYKGTSYQNG